MDRKAADDEYDEYYVGDDGSYEQIERNLASLNLTP